MVSHVEVLAELLCQDLGVKGVKCMGEAANRSLDKVLRSFRYSWMVSMLKALALLVCKLEGVEQ